MSSESVDYSSEEIPLRTDTRSINSLDRLDIMDRVREATASPSPLTQFLQDPEVLQVLTRTKHKKQRQSSPHREPPSPSVMSRVLADEERQVNRLKSLLRSTGDRLEYEIRRADEATARAEYAETRAKEACARLGVSEASRGRSEIEATKSNDEARMYRLRLESAEHEMGRLRSDIEHLQKRRKEAEELVSKTNDAAREFQIALNDCKAREREREDVAQIELDTWFNQGKEDGWDAGYAEGLEEGRSEGFKHGLKIGKKEGFDQGLKVGHKEERQNALQAFDRFLADEMDDDQDLSPQERTRKWAESIYRTNANPSPAPETPLRSRPPELRRRFYTESELSSRTGSPRSSRNYQDRQ